MPRTSVVECPGCPPLRALTTDALGLVKVVEARGNAGIPKVVETWGPPDASRCVLAASFADREKNPVLAVARKNDLVEFLNPMNGDSLAATKVCESSSSSQALEDDLIVGLHLLNTETIELSSRLIVFLTCTAKGKACLRSNTTSDASPKSVHNATSSTWDVCSAGKVICSAVDANERCALFGGKGIEVNAWDIEKCSKIWTAKSPPCNSLGIFSPTWFTAATFLNKEDHRKIAAGTNNHQVRLYDISAQRRPVISFSFRESPIKVVTEDLDGYTIYIGTGTGDLASFDMRTGKLLGCFVGKCCGSIRSIARHPELPLIASCGLDRYLRFWDTKTRQLLSAVFLKQHLTNVVIDSHFSAGESTVTSVDQPSNLQVIDRNEVEDDDELLLFGSGASKKKEGSKIKTKKSKNKVQGGDQTSGPHSSSSKVEDDNERPASKRRMSLEGKEQSRRLKRISSNKCLSPSHMIKSQ